MPKHLTIQWKAFVLLLAFTASFCVICHCGVSAAPNASRAHACCEKHSHKQSDHKDCNGAKAVKFNLEEKQAATSIELAPVTVFLITNYYATPAPVLLSVNRSRNLPAHWAYKHAPPDLQVLYQRFLI